MRWQEKKTDFFLTSSLKKWRFYNLLINIFLRFFVICFWVTQHLYRHLRRHKLANITQLTFKFQMGDTMAKSGKDAGI